MAHRALMAHTSPHRRHPLRNSEGESTHGTCPEISPADQEKYVNSSGYDLEPGWLFFPISAVSGSLALGLQEHHCD